jgi:hypothetical protein
LYAHDRATQHFLLLATRTTPDQVQSAWLDLNSLTTSPDGYLAFASLEGAPPLSPAVEAGQLLLRCVEQEMAAYDEFVATGPDHALRFDAAYAVVVQRSARIAAEDAQIDAVRSAAADNGPVVIRYRVLGESGWTGRVAGESLQSAADDARRVHAIGERHGLVTQATSVSQHHAVISAARVPEVAFMLHLPEVPSSAPRLEL